MFAIQKASVGIGSLCKSAYPRGPLLNTIVDHNGVEGIRLILWLQCITLEHYSKLLQNLIQHVL